MSPETPPQPEASPRVGAASRGSKGGGRGSWGSRPRLNSDAPPGLSGQAERLLGHGQVHHQQPEVGPVAERVERSLGKDRVGVAESQGRGLAQQVHRRVGLRRGPIGRDPRPGRPGQAGQLGVATRGLVPMLARPRRQSVEEPQCAMGVRRRAGGIAQVAVRQPATTHRARQVAPV